MVVKGLLNNPLNPKGALFYLGLIAVFVHPDPTIPYLVLLVCTTLGISACFWALFVYVLQVSTVRKRLLSIVKLTNRVLGTALIALGIRVWFAGSPEQ